MLSPSPARPKQDARIGGNEGRSCEEGQRVYASSSGGLSEGAQVSIDEFLTKNHCNMLELGDWRGEMNASFHTALVVLSPF